MVEPLISMELEGDEKKEERKDKVEDDVVEEEVRGGAAEEGTSNETKQEEDSSTIVRQYSNFDADEFTQFITSRPGVDVSIGLCELIQFKEGLLIAESVANIYDWRKPRSTANFLLLVKHAITSEVQKQAEKNTILRGNSVCTKLMGACAKIYANEYIQHTLGPHIREICENVPQVEIEPSRLKAGENETENQMRLAKCCQDIFDSIIHSITVVPKEIRIICKQLNDEVNRKFEEGIGRRALAAFFFLRFLCPAIFLPATHGLLSAQPSAEASRALTLISKTIQSLASGSDGVNTKETYLSAMKGFIAENRVPLYNFLDELPNFKDGDEVVPIPASPRKASEGTSTGKGKEPMGDDKEREEVTTKKEDEEKVGEESSSPSNPQDEGASAAPPTSASNDDDGEERRLDDSTAESSTSRSPATTTTSTTSNSEVNSTKDETGAASTSPSEDDDKSKKDAEAAPATADEDKQGSKSEEATEKATEEATEKPPKKPSTPVPPELDRHIAVIINAIANHKAALDAYLLDEANFPGRVDSNKESTEQLNEFVKNLKKDVPVTNKPATKIEVEESPKGRKGGSKKGWRCNIL